MHTHAQAPTRRPHTPLPGGVVPPVRRPAPANRPPVPAPIRGGIKIAPPKTVDWSHGTRSSSTSTRIAGRFASISGFQRMYDSAHGITWFGREGMVDGQGRVWHRDYDAVVDDFGNLVEVA